MGLTYVTDEFAEAAWTTVGELGTEELEALVKVLKLHTGNPGKEGKENNATETTLKEIGELEKPDLRTRTNKNAIEWKAVKAKETYKFVSFRNEAGVFQGYIELDEPVEVEEGDTFIINAKDFSLKVAE